MVHFQLLILYSAFIYSMNNCTYIWQRAWFLLVKIYSCQKDCLKKCPFLDSKAQNSPNLDMVNLQKRVLHIFKGIVQRELRGVKIGINRSTYDVLSCRQVSFTLPRSADALTELVLRCCVYWPNRLGWRQKVLSRWKCLCYSRDGVPWAS